MHRLDQGVASLFNSEAWDTNDFNGLGPDVSTISAANPGTPRALTDSRVPSTDNGTTVLYSPDGGSFAKAGQGGTPPGTSLGVVTTTTLGSPFVINISWDASVASAPSGFTAGVTAAVQYLESQFSDAVTINISVGYGEVNGNALGGNALGQSLTYLTSTSYSTLTGALARDATTATDASSVASLPATAPVNGTFWTTTAEAKALGLSAANGASTDGYVGFSSAYPFTYNNAGGVASGTYDFNGVVLHEISEVMGRMMLTGGSIGSTANSFLAYDLFHFSAPGVRTFSSSTPGYLSADNGTTALGALNTSGGDPGDWSSAVTNDAGDAISNSGVINVFSSADLTALDTIGWNLGAAPPPPAPAPAPAPPTAPSGVVASPVTLGIAAIATAPGIAANAALATLTQTGGPSGDSYTYTLGGTGAASFALTGAGTLSAGASGVAGAANGRVYALTGTATDTTNGLSSPASPIDVVLGASGDDTVSLATLVGAASTSVPTFIYGLAGNDTINGAGMTGPLWINGGAGADTMTGGSGANFYEYGAASDSTASAMDIITNFHAATDTIDLRGLGGHALSFVGKTGLKNLAAYSVGYQSSGGNTFVVVNTTGSNQSLSATSMRIELLGSVGLGSGNILHT